MTSDFQPDQLEMLLKEYRAEAGEHLDLIGRGLLIFEDRGVAACDPEVIRDVARRLHSIKGAALALQQDQVSQVTHAFERVFKSASRAEPVRADACDRMLRALDWLRSALVSLQPESSVAATEELLSGALGPDVEAAAAAVTAAVDGGMRTAPDAPAAEGPPSDRDDSLRVDIAVLDALIAEVDDVVLLQARGKALADGIDALGEACGQPGGDAESRDAAFAALRKSLESLARDAAGISHDMKHATEGLREQMAQLRVIPLASILGSLRRSVRDIAKRQGKRIEIVVSGEYVPLDRKVIEWLKDPLGHLVRNAIDHGVEEPAERERAGKPPVASLRLTAVAVDNMLSLTVADDGCGIDPEKLRAKAVAAGLLTQDEALAMTDAQALELIFGAGFSTAEKVTEISGRGVGLDVVRHHVSRLGGELRVQSTIGKGTSFTLTVPLALSSTRGLLCRIQRLVVCVPIISVDEILPLTGANLGAVDGRRYMTVRGEPVDIIDLSQVIAVPGAYEEPAYVVMLHSEGQRGAIGVSEIIAEQEIVIKSLPVQLQDLNGISGATVLADRRIIPVLDVRQIIGKKHTHASRPRAATTQRSRILVVDDTTATRLVIAGTLEAAGFDVVQAADGSIALHMLSTSDTSYAGNVDAVVTDVDMPRVDGLMLTECIRAMAVGERLPVVIVSANESPEDVQKGLQAGADAYILKGTLRDGALVSTLRRLLPVSNP